MGARASARATAIVCCQGLVGRTVRGNWYVEFPFDNWRCPSLLDDVRVQGARQFTPDAIKSCACESGSGLCGGACRRRQSSLEVHTVKPAGCSEGLCADCVRYGATKRRDSSQAPTLRLVDGSRLDRDSIGEGALFVGRSVGDAMPRTRCKIGATALTDSEDVSCSAKPSDVR